MGSLGSVTCGKGIIAKEDPRPQHGGFPLHLSVNWLFD